MLKIDWNVQNDLILTSGEDCKYKIWNADGILLFSSSSHDTVITTAAWAPNGEYFLVGTFNSVKLCDKGGWSYFVKDLDRGSIMEVAWNPDSMILALCSAQGQIFTGHIIDKKFEWENWEAILTQDNK